MVPPTRAAKLAALVDQEREHQAPSLPLELWHLIFAQNTNPKHLWTVGRQVCSMWRSEIPKIMAKKYLEDPKMTQIHSDCEIARERSQSCVMGSKLIFSHYKDNKTRAVFKKCPEDEEYEHFDLCPENLARAKEEKSRSLDDFFIEGALDPESCPVCRREPTSTSSSKRCDLPPYQIRIKWEANDTELPGLEVDFERAEISFGWYGMFEMYFLEAAILDRHDDEIATAALQWLHREESSMASIVARACRDNKARYEYRKEVRRARNKRRGYELHCFGNGCKSDREDLILEACIWLEKPKGACTEDKEEKQMKEFQKNAQRKLSRMEMHLNSRPGDGERFLSAAWKQKLVDVPHNKRGEFEARYAMQWLGRQRM
jgi:hypothetical protein